MKKIFITVLIILIIILLFLLIGKSQLKEDKIELIPTIPKPTVTPFNLPTSEKIIINDVSINNFYQEDIQKNPQNDALISQNNDYQIVYLPQFQQFLITILNPDFEKTKVTAEAAFLKQLGITEDEACKLSVSISTPLFINENLSGQIFPLSFCR